MGYVSRILKGEQKVRAKDFEELSALTFNGDEPNPKKRRRDITLWNRHIGISPEDFTNIIQSWFYVDLRIDVQLTRAGLMTVTLNSPQDVFLDSYFSADLANREFSKKGKLRLTSRNEGKGLATAWFASQIELYAAVGAKEIKYRAKLINGARKWARMGMHIDIENTDPAKLARTSRNLKAKLETFYKIGVIDEAKYKEMLPYTDLKNPDDLVQLIAHDFIIPESLVSSEGVHINRDFMTALEESIEGHIDAENAVPSGKLAEEQAGELVQIWNRVKPQQKPIPFSQYGLFKGEYNAIVRFDDADQMEQVESNVRGWKFGVLKC